MGRRLHALVLVVVLFSVVAPGAAQASGSWVRPVEGAVARSFDPPRSRFGAGHLGIDLDATAGARVRAAGPGVVVFAGSVAGALHVVVAHAGNLRTSYSFLASIAVRRGESVTGGQVVGTTGGRGQGHDGSVLHFGLRVGDSYVDPATLFGTVDLSAVVHLAPTTDPPRATNVSSERRGLLDGLARDAGVIARGAGAVAQAALATAGRATIVAGRALGRAFTTGHPLAAAAAAAAASWIEQRTHCDAHAPPADGGGGSGHRVMLVAGIESSLNADHPALALPVAKLGYEPGEVSQFSYAAGGGDYVPADTEGPIIVAARRLGEQLRTLQRLEPGREVDLLAHSQGGVVVEAFLTLIYERHDRSYPPLGTVVTLSSPLRGDPLASAESNLARTRSGADTLRAVSRVARVTGSPLPLLTPALRDMAAGSQLMRRLDAARLPDEVEVTTVGAATDVVVPGDAATRSGARGTTVVPHALNAHSAILEDPSALSAVRAALERKPLPCQSLTATLVGAVVPITISTLEERVGRIGAAAGRVADGGL